IIKNALDSLNSSKQSLSAIIRDNRYIIKYRTFCEFIYGQPQTNYPGFNFNGKTNLVIAMTCISISANDDDGDYYKTLRALHIAEFINQKLAGLSFGADILQTYKNEIIIILMNTAVIPDAAIKVREILASLNNNIRLNFTDVLALNTGVGIAADKPSMISESYFLARRAMEYAKINGEFNIIFQEDYIVQENSTDLVTWENRLLKLLADRKTEPIKILVDEITEEAASTPARFTYDRLYDFYVRIIFESILSFSQINPKIAQTLSQKPYISDFSRTGNLAEKGRWLKSFYSEIISITLDPENNPGLLKNKIRGACEYIRENYTRLITLDDIAQKVNLNPSYFSTVFKAQTGLTFTDYINKMRIDEAKSLLKTGESISGISAAIGYVSVNQLNRFFKKYEKITPAQYRENLNFTGQS
ncbi:MAG: AraC family transcriptional regulator, partial [Treponema sp.]|nr:AraC family transcriptional regulator [Treponema sp.]